jgi:ABC-2 type transport system permease protein
MTIDFNMVKRLTLKDWQVHQKVIAGYVAGGILGLAIFGMPHVYAFYMGAVTMLTVMVASGFHALSLTVVNEKKEQTLPFIMSLPIRPVEYALAKLMANFTIFMVPWTVMMMGLIFVTLFGSIPDGLLPFLVLIGTLVVANYCIVVCVTMITESEGLSILTMVIVNLLLNPAIMLMANNPDFYSHFKTETIVWPAIASQILLAQLVVIGASIALVLYHQARRLTFM